MPAHKVKMQYVQIQNKLDTSIKHEISSQSTSMLKGCMYMFDIVDTSFSNGRAPIVYLFLEEFSR